MIGSIAGRGKSCSTENSHHPEISAFETPWRYDVSQELIGEENS
jgi:hypothetical protein